MSTDDRQRLTFFVYEAETPMLAAWVKRNRRSWPVLVRMKLEEVIRAGQMPGIQPDAPEPLQEAPRPKPAPKQAKAQAAPEPAPQQTPAQPEQPVSPSAPPPATAPAAPAGQDDEARRREEEIRERARRALAMNATMFRDGGQ